MNSEKQQDPQLSEKKENPSEQKRDASEKVQGTKENSLDQRTSAPKEKLPENNNPSEQRAQALKEKFSHALKDRYHLIFLGIFILVIVIRLYYFWMAQQQPLWWDEADYLAYAKNIAGFNVDWIATSQHNSLFSYMAAFFFALGISEAVARFFLAILPAILLVYIVYKILSMMYQDKQIALSAAFLTATFWEMFFYSMRFHVEGPALVFGFLAVYIFWQGYERKEKILGKIPHQWAMPLVVFLVVLTYATRRGYFLFGFFFLSYMIFTRKWKELVKDKYNWIALSIFLILFWIVEKLVFVAPIADVAGLYYQANAPFSLYPFKVFDAYFISVNKPFWPLYYLYQPFWSPLYYLFWMGLVMLAAKLILTFGYFKKTAHTEVKADLFIFITIAVTLAYFLFYQREAGTFGDSRWYYPLLIGSYVCISKSTLFIAKLAGKYNQWIAVIIIALLIGYGGYDQFKHADSIIRNKVSSYQGMKDAGLLVKELSQPSDAVISVALPQAAYYAERKVIHPFSVQGRDNKNITQEEFLAEIEKNPSIKYLLISFIEPNHPSWLRKEGEEYASQPQTGQVVLAKWEIPLMDTKIDFLKNQQEIKQEKTYGNITFKLLKITDGIFVYGIERKEKSTNSTF